MKKRNARSGRIAGKRIFRGAAAFFAAALLILTAAGCGAAGSGSSGATAPNETYGPATVSFEEKDGRLILSAPDGYEIYYTTDGSVPDSSSERYRKPISIRKNVNNWLTEKVIPQILIENYYQLYTTPDIPDLCIVRAIAEAPDRTPGPVVTKTFFPDKRVLEAYGDALVVSIVTDPENLLDYEKGIFVKGKLYDEFTESEEGKAIIRQGEYWFIEGNYSQSGKASERPAAVEFFDRAFGTDVTIDCGIRIHGGMSRTNPRKGLRLYFREQYGCRYFPYDPFSDREKGGETQGPRRKVLVLRNGGNTANVLPMKDGWQQSLLEGMGFATQKTRAAVVYVNGEYWGVCALNDRYDDLYIEEEYGVKNALVVKEGELQEGAEESMELYRELCAFEEKDLSDPMEWDTFCRCMDIESMAAFFAVHVYIGSPDVKPDSNIEMWRSVETGDGPYEDGRWRYLLYDTEFSSGLYRLVRKDTGYDFDSLSLALEQNPLLRSAFSNEEFRTLFLEKLKEVGSERMSPERVNESLDQWLAEWTPLLDDQYARFGSSAEETRTEADVIREFYANRYDFIVPAAEKIIAEYS